MAGIPTGSCGMGGLLDNMREFVDTVDRNDSYGDIFETCECHLKG